MCVARLRSNFDSSTVSHSSTYVGMFRVDERWWCGKNEIGGNCKVKCQDLVDDINLDAKCGRLILKMSGLGAWFANQACANIDENIDNCFE